MTSPPTSTLELTTKTRGAAPGGFLHGPGFNDQRNLDLDKVSSDTIGSAETEVFWRTFLRELLGRSLSGVQFVVKDAQEV